MRYVALWLTAICVVLFILQTLFPIVTYTFVLVSSEVLLRPWVLITSLFLHGGTNHLISNMFMLALFGTILEKVIGYKKFLGLYFVAGLIANLGTLPFYGSSLGASGAIMGIMGCLAVLRPRMTVYLGYVPMPMIVAAVVWAALDLFGAFVPIDNTGHIAHLFGMGFGIIIGLYYMKKFGEKAVKIKTGTISDRTMRRWEDNWL